VWGEGGEGRRRFPFCDAKRARIWLLEGSEGIWAALPGWWWGLGSKQDLPFLRRRYYLRQQ